MITITRLPVSPPRPVPSLFLRKKSKSDSPDRHGGSGGTLPAQRTQKQRPRTRKKKFVMVVRFFVLPHDFLPCQVNTQCKFLNFILSFIFLIPLLRSFGEYGMLALKIL
jgi:hypothetical protein